MLLNSLAAQTTGSSITGGWQTLLPLVLIFGVMYFLIIRPQNKRVKDQQNMQAAIKVGDTITTAGGLIGRVTKLEDKEIHVDFNRSGQSVRVLRTAVASILDPQNKAKTMTQSNQPSTKSAEKDQARTEESSKTKQRVRSPLNRGRAGNNRRPAIKKTETEE